MCNSFTQEQWFDHSRKVTLASLDLCSCPSTPAFRPPSQFSACIDLLFWTVTCMAEISVCGCLWPLHLCQLCLMFSYLVQLVLPFLQLPVLLCMCAMLYLSRQHSGVSGAFLLCHEESCPGHMCTFSFFMETCVLDILGSQLELLEMSQLFNLLGKQKKQKQKKTTKFLQNGITVLDLFFTFYVYECFACMYVWPSCLCLVPSKVRREPSGTRVTGGY